MSTIDELCTELAQLQRLEQEGKDMSALIAKVNQRLEEELDKLRRTDNFTHH